MRDLRDLRLKTVLRHAARGPRCAAVMSLMSARRLAVALRLCPGMVHRLDGVAYPAKVAAVIPGRRPRRQGGKKIADREASDDRIEPWRLGALAVHSAVKAGFADGRLPHGRYRLGAPVGGCPNVIPLRPHPSVAVINVAKQSPGECAPCWGLPRRCAPRNDREGLIVYVSCVHPITPGDERTDRLASPFIMAKPGHDTGGPGVS